MDSLFQQLGLDKTEAQVYSALLTLGSATVTEITSTAGITRTLGYSVLEKLQSYGLIKDVPRETSKKKLFVAESPDKIIDFLEDKKKELNKKLAQAKDSLPCMLSLYKMGTKPILRYEEDVSVVRNVSRETFTEEEEIFSIVNLNNANDTLVDIVLKDIEAERKHNKYLFIDHAPQTQVDYRVISSEISSSLQEVVGKVSIQGKRIVAITEKQFDACAIVIESEFLAHMIRALFEVSWSSVSRETV